LYSSCSEKAPFVVHKITIDYAFDQVFRAKMQSLHENFAPLILVFRHELPFFPSYFVWNPFFSLFLFFLLSRFLCIPSSSFASCFVYSHQSIQSAISCFLPCSFYYLPRNPKNVGDFSEKVHRFSENLHRFSENLHRFFENLHRFFVFLGDVAKLSCLQMCLWKEKHALHKPFRMILFTIISEKRKGFVYEK